MEEFCIQREEGVSSSNLVTADVSVEPEQLMSEHKICPSNPSSILQNLRRLDTKRLKEVLEGYRHIVTGSGLPTTSSNYVSVQNVQTVQKEDAEKEEQETGKLLEAGQHSRLRRRIKMQDPNKLLLTNFLNYPEDGLKMEIIQGKGRGVISNKIFQKGDLVVEYRGELITKKEADIREKTYREADNIGCYMLYFQYKGKKFCIDATQESEFHGRIVNHSRKIFNVVPKVFEFNNMPRVILIAKRDINLGEEILFDYGDRTRFSTQNNPWLKE